MAGERSPCFIAVKSVHGLDIVERSGAFLLPPPSLVTPTCCSTSRPQVSGASLNRMFVGRRCLDNLSDCRKSNEFSHLHIWLLMFGKVGAVG